MKRFGECPSVSGGDELADAACLLGDGWQDMPITLAMITARQRGIDFLALLDADFRLSLGNELPRRNP